MGEINFGRTIPLEKSFCDLKFWVTTFLKSRGHVAITADRIMIVISQLRLGLERESRQYAEGSGFCETLPAPSVQSSFLPAAVHNLSVKKGKNFLLCA